MKKKTSRNVKGQKFRMAQRFDADQVLTIPQLSSRGLKNKHYQNEVCLLFFSNFSSICHIVLTIFFMRNKYVLLMV